jgi:uroporphyrinogen-III synthase
MPPKAIVTRPLAQSKVTASKLREQGWDVLETPLFDIAALNPTLPPADNYQAIILTSANAVPALSTYLSLPIYTVGETTAEAAREAGAKNVTTAARDGEALLSLIKEKLKPDAGKLLYLGGTERAMDVAGVLAPAHFTEDVVEVYSRTPLASLAPETIAALQAPATVLLYSPRTARHFRALFDTAGLAPGVITIAALSPKVAEAAGSGWAKTIIAPEPNETALIQALLPTGKACYISPMNRLAIPLSLFALLATVSTPLWLPHLMPLPTNQSAAAPDLGPIMNRFASLERENAALRTELESLKTAQANLSSQTDILTRLDNLSGRLSTVEGADSNMAQLQGTVETLKQQVAQQQGVDIAARIRLSQTLQLISALAAGDPYASPLADLNLAGAEAILPFKDTGLPTLAALSATFPAAARTALKASRPAGETWIDQSMNSIKGLVSIRRQGEVAGEDMEAVLARAEGSLKANNLPAALQTLAGLSNPSILGEWWERAKAREQADELVKKLTHDVAASLVAP